MTEKNLRSGYTTGTCASAAAKAAALFLLCESSSDEVEIALPGGTVAMIPVKQVTIQECASYCVKKDAGDDPDVTHGAWIYAEVKRLTEAELEEMKEHAPGYWLPDYPKLYLTGGRGIGLVTNPGLSCPVGHYAINPVPQRMILSSVGQVFDSGAEDCCLLITIWIPAGEELAKKTFNPRLGIEGGISVLGTTGIVKPMSEEALLATIRLDIHMQTLQRGRILLMAPGNYGERFLKEKFGILPGSAVLCSNFVGAAMKMAAREELDRVLFVGHIGKLVKVAAGVRNTHSRYGDGRMEEMSRLTRQVIAQRSQQTKQPQQTQQQQQSQPQECAGLVERTAICNTTEEAIRLLKEAGIAEQVLQMAAERVKQQMEEWVGQRLQVEAVAFSSANEVFGCTAEAQNTLELWEKQVVQ